MRCARFVIVIRLVTSAQRSHSSRHAYMSANCFFVGRERRKSTPPKKKFYKNCGTLLKKMATRLKEGGRYPWLLCVPRPCSRGTRPSPPILLLQTQPVRKTIPVSVCDSPRVSGDQLIFFYLRGKGVAIAGERAVKKLHSAASECAPLPHPF